MNMEIVENLFPDLHEVHIGFFNACHATLRAKLDALLKYLAVAGFVVKADVDTQMQDVDDVGTSLVSELSVQLFDPASGVTLRAVAFVDSDIADPDTFALDTMMGLSVYRLDTQPGQAHPEVSVIVTDSAVAYGAKPHQDSAQQAFAELANLNVESLCNTVQADLAP
jgi:hypothetical protein